MIYGNDESSQSEWNPKLPEENPKSNPFVAGSIGFVAILSFAMQGPILSLFIVDLGATVGILGIILGTRGLVDMFIRIPLSSASDKVGRKLLCILGLTCFTLTQLVLVMAGITGNWTIIILAMIIQSIGTSSLMPSLLAYFSDLYPKERSGESMGRLFRFTDLAHIIGPFISGFLVSSMGFSYTQVFATSFMASFLGSILALSFFRETLEEKTSSRETIRIFLQEIEVSIRRIKATISKRETLAPNLAIYFFAASVISLTEFFPLLGREHHLIEGEIGTVMSSRKGFPWYFKVKLGMVSDVYGRTLSVMFSFFAISVLLLAVSIADSFLWFMILVIVTGFLQGIGMPAINGAILDMVPETERGTYIGTWGVFYSAGKASSNILFGLIASFFGIAAIFVVAGILVALGAIFFKFATPPIPPTLIAEPVEPITVFSEVDR